MARLPLAQLVVLALAALCNARANLSRGPAVALGPRLALAAGLGLAALVRPVVGATPSCSYQGFITYTAYSSSTCSASSVTSQVIYNTMDSSSDACTFVSIYPNGKGCTAATSGGATLQLVSLQQIRRA